MYYGVENIILYEQSVVRFIEKKIMFLNAKSIDSGDEATKWINVFNKHAYV